ncbi:zinc finger protein 28 [Drosophila persimilis]|uniref:zinc finger protein 28 n=1 Tax=Drosophila persimilis TaxID=7234 RepID=UPI000F083BC5|nr:zinc finger protein 28 [Drosophila persimilis]
MGKCPRCDCEATGQNRLVTDSCGHTKCRLCLVADVSDCLECTNKETVSPKKISNAKMTADKRITITDQGYHCTVCKKDFRSRTQQYYHLTCGNDLLKKFCCKQCNRRFATHSHLKYHQNNHVSLSKYSCSICGKKFKQPNVLQRHMRIHNNEQHACDHCHKVFRCLSTLKDHLVAHTDHGFAYKCETCAKLFQNKANLNQHRQKHDQNSSRHKCKVCQKSFLRQSTLRLHMKRHALRERQPCPLCGKSYNDADALARHLRQHKTVERYRCTQCDVTVNRRDNMHRHLRSMHPGVSFESSVEIITPTRALEPETAEGTPTESLRYNSVIKSVGNVEPVLLPPPLPEVQLEQQQAPVMTTAPKPLPDAMQKQNVKLYRKIILDLDNEEYSNELTMEEEVSTGQDSAAMQEQRQQQRGPGHSTSNFSEMHWRKNFKYSYENEHTN